MKAMLIYGSRTWEDELSIVLALEIEKPDIVMHGGAAGADRIAGEVAGKANLLYVFDYPADWETHGKKAGYLRNCEMIDALRNFHKNGYEVCAYGFRMPGESRGTDMMTAMLEKAEIRHRVINW